MSDDHFFRKRWWIFGGLLSAVVLATALNIDNTDGWIVVTNSSNVSWTVNWNTSKPTTCATGNYSYWTGSGFACAPDQAGSANLSGYVPYIGATQNVNINGYILQSHGVRSTDSAGLLIESASGTDSAVFGVANTANILFYGSLDMNAGTNICLNGVCRSTWPADTYANVTALQTANTTTNSRVDSLNSTKLDATDQRYNDTAAINAVSTFAQTKAATGTVDCGSGNFLRVLTINNGSWTTTCAADQTAAGGLTEWVNYTATARNSSNNTVFTAMPELTVTLLNNSRYIISCNFITLAAAATTGEQLQINITGSPSNFTSTFVSLVSATTISSLQSTSTTSNTYADTGSAGTNLRDITRLQAYVITGASNVGLTYFIKSEIAASAVIYDAGSMCRYTKVA